MLDKGLCVKAPTDYANILNLSIKWWWEPF